eukprot:CAMPEP_0118917092 /NCGR_PEP_ID=MMETSP1166-20130328/17027_1 /TAXON_ID=1104430 /ORGANISM="Chrysoreinhardia sp, Strain CCMP3193" /LENGTH=98 /DNA_ID=CAMNT_0006857143 /DNA_START=150 /DNA_END=446 /DNA_ORIENTATION=+
MIALTRDCDESVASGHITALAACAAAPTNHRSVVAQSDGVRPAESNRDKAAASRSVIGQATAAPGSHLSVGAQSGALRIAAPNRDEAAARRRVPAPAT